MPVKDSILDCHHSGGQRILIQNFDSTDRTDGEEVLDDLH